MLDLNRYHVLTFDVYGTLIDWEQGILSALKPILAAHNVALDDEAVLKAYGELEADAETGPYHRYRAVMRECVNRLGQRLGFTPSSEEAESLAESLPRWEPFPDTVEALQALKRRYRLAVISNVDEDLFAGTAERLGSPFDWVVTAEAAGSYKPSSNNFRVALERIGEPKEHILHVAQSLYHDIAPAKALGLSTVWVNRRRGLEGGATPPSDAQPDMEAPDLRTLSEWAGTGN